MHDLADPIVKRPGVVVVERQDATAKVPNPPWTFKDLADDCLTLEYTGDQPDGQTLSVSTSSIIGIWSAKAEGTETLLYTVDSGENVPNAVPEIHKAEVAELPDAMLERYAQRSTLKQRAGLSSPSSASKSHIQVVVSTESGAKLAKNFWQTSLQPVLKEISRYDDFDLSIHETTSADSISELAEAEWRPLIKAGDDLFIILLSGDGGLTDAVNGLGGWEEVPANRPTLLTLPLGTGNATFSSYSYHAQDDTWGLSTLVRGTRQHLPTFGITFSDGARLLVNEAREERQLKRGSINGLHGAVVCSWGLHSTLVADSDTAHYRQFGADRFKMVAKQLLSPDDGGPPHEYKGTVSISGEESDEWHELSRGEHSYVLATLVSNLEKTFMISPDSVIQDGSLRLVDLPPLSGERIMEIMTAAYQGGKHVGMEGVRYQKIRSMRIQMHEEDGQWRRVCVDGKIIRLEPNGWLQLELDRDSGIDYVCMPPTGDET